MEGVNNNAAMVSMKAEDMCCCCIFGVVHSRLKLLCGCFLITHAFWCLFHPTQHFHFSSPPVLDSCNATPHYRKPLTVLLSASPYVIVVSCCMPTACLALIVSCFFYNFFFSAGRHKTFHTACTDRSWNLCHALIFFPPVLFLCWQR